MLIVGASVSPDVCTGEPCASDELDSSVPLEASVRGKGTHCLGVQQSDSDSDSRSKLLCSLTSPCGHVVNVFDDCVKGICKCIYVLGGVKSQLKPCRFSALVHLENADWAKRFEGLVWNVTDGFPIIDSVVSGYECENYSSITTGDAKAKMDKIVSRELEEGCISPSKGKPTCVHALGAVPKTGGGIRPITDCSRPLGTSVNNHCRSLLHDFSFKNIEYVVSLLSGDEFMSVIDIKSAYRAVPIRPEHRVYQGFKWNLSGESKYYVDNRLCFGSRLGPSYFNEISTFIHSVATNMYGINIVNYLDDFLVIADELSVALESRDRVIKLLRFLGFHVAYDKVIYPSKCVTYLGIIIDTERGELRLPDGKLEKLTSLLQYHLGKNRVSKNNLESIGGLLSHCAHLVKGGRIFCRSTYDLHKSLVHSGKRFINLSENIKSDFSWWLKVFPYFNGTMKLFSQEFNFPMVSDSSLKGFAVFLDRDWVAGTWRDSDYIPLTTECSHVGFRPVWDSFDASNINELELWPIVVGLKRWLNLFKDKSVMVFTDNTQVMFMLINGCSSNSTCNRWLREIFWLCAVFNVSLQPRYISTKSNLVADTLSRLVYFKSDVKLREYLENSGLCCIDSLFMAYRVEGQETAGEG